MDARSLRTARAEDRKQIAAARRRRGRDAPWRRRMRDLRRRITQGLAVVLVPRLVRILARTWRIEWRGATATAATPSTEPVIYVLWHGRMLIGAATHRDRGLAVLVSPSGDGAIAVGVLQRLDFLAFRGSASRGGARALKDLATHLAAGRSVALTPDGPRGPRHAFNVGAAWLARATGAAIVPAAIATDRAWRLKSWDRFTIPKPRARVVVAYGTPVHVASGREDADLEHIGSQLRADLIAAERTAFDELGVPHDHGG